MTYQGQIKLKRTAKRRAEPTSVHFFTSENKCSWAEGAVSIHKYLYKKLAPALPLLREGVLQKSSFTWIIFLIYMLTDSSKTIELKRMCLNRKAKDNLKNDFSGTIKMDI